MARVSEGLVCIEIGVAIALVFALWRFARGRCVDGMNFVERESGEGRRRWETVSGGVPCAGKRKLRVVHRTRSRIFGRLHVCALLLAFKLPGVSQTIHARARQGSTEVSARLSWGVRQCRT